jgi:hypothetical protein
VKNDKILKAMSGIDYELVSRAAAPVKKENEKRVNFALWLKWAMPVAACLVLAIGLFSMHGVLFPSISGTGGSNNVPQAAAGGGSENGGSVDSALAGGIEGASPAVAPPASKPQPVLRIGKTTFMRPFSSDVMNGFEMSLTEEQIKQIVPGLSLTLGGSGQYQMDGSLYRLALIETEKPARTDLPAYHGEYYYRTAIEISPLGDVRSDSVLEGNGSKVTNMNGIEVSSFKFIGNDKNIVYYQSDFKIVGIGYRVSIYDSANKINQGDEKGAVRLTEIVSGIINSRSADLSDVLTADYPDLRSDELTLEQAYEESDFGAYIPNGIPNEFEFSTSYRVNKPNQNDLSVHWATGCKYIEITAGDAALNGDLYDDEVYGYSGTLVHANETEKYDLSLYPVPRADSVPDELRLVVDSPVFYADEMTIDVIGKRIYTLGETGENEINVPRADFSVLYGDVLVNFMSKGLSAEQIWTMVQEVGNNNGGVR